MSNCTICGHPIVLMPSAAERARRYGAKPSDFTRLFTTHSQCAIQKRTQQAIDNIRRQRIAGTP